MAKMLERKRMAFRERPLGELVNVIIEADGSSSIKFSDGTYIVLTARETYLLTMTAPLI